MLHIPPEILRTISTLVREEQGLRVLTDLSSVCKVWRDVAQPVLWSHVILNNDTLQSFIENHENVTDKLKVVRSITLHIEVITLALPISQYEAATLKSYEKHGSPKSQSLHQNIGQFSDLISPKLSSLESFSFFVDAPPVDEACQRINPYDIGFWLETAVLGRLLRSLPASCTSLELDTSGTDWSPRPEPHHLCPDIWYILPRLRHIKLRIHDLCSRILLQDPSDPGARRDEPDLRQHRSSNTGSPVHAGRLSTLSICIFSRMRAGHGFNSCPNLQTKLDRGANPWLINGSFDFDSKPLLLAPNLVFGYRTGCFPAALKLEVVEQRLSFSTELEEYDDEWDIMTDQEKQRAQLYGYAILMRDCIEDKTYPMPLRYVGDGMHGLYDKSDTCIVGAEENLERHAENTVWDGTSYGARMPFGAKTYLAGAITRSPHELLTRKEWRQRSKRGMLSWRGDEVKLGVKIRRVIPLDGVDVDFDYSLMPLLPARGEPIPGTEYIGGVY
jgi:hypothetical protein